MPATLNPKPIQARKSNEKAEICKFMVQNIVGQQEQDRFYLKCAIIKHLIMFTPDFWKRAPHRGPLKIMYAVHSGRRNIFGKCFNYLETLTSTTQIFAANILFLMLVYFQTTHQRWRHLIKKKKKRPFQPEFGVFSQFLKAFFICCLNAKSLFKLYQCVKPFLNGSFTSVKSQ